MLIGEACTRDVIVVERQESVIEAAQLMRRYHVGPVVVTDQPDGSRLPVGILTDRDIVVEMVAQQVDFASVTVADVMSNRLLMLSPELGVSEALGRMAEKGVRRAPVVDDNDVLIGILALDDDHIAGACLSNKHIDLQRVTLCVL